MTSVHVHLALNHIPVLFIPLAIVLTVFALMQKNKSILRVSYAILIFSAMVSVPVYLSGEESEDLAETLPQVTEEVIENHEEVAENAFYLALALGALAAFAFVLSYKYPSYENYAAKALILLGLLVSALMIYAANLGGQIRHTEIRPSNNLQTYPDHY